ncbi:MAG: flavodoxin family protein [Planctomycetota bacterium]
MIALSRTALLIFLLLGAGCGQEPSSEVPASSAPRPKAAGAPGSVLVAYWTKNGNTKALAETVAEGAREIEGTDVVLKAMSDVTAEDLARCDGLALGSATHFANLPGEAKTILDRWSYEWQVDFTDKVGGAFATGGDVTGGKEHVVVSLLLYMLSNRMILAGPLHGEGPRSWGEMGASATTGEVSRGVQDEERQSARKLGHRLADLAMRISRGDK